MNCTCTAYPFPHRPNGGRCLHDQILAVKTTVEESAWIDLSFAEAEEALSDWDSPLDAARAVLDEAHDIHPAAIRY